MKSVLIVFTDPHLPYAPTIINLFNELKKHVRVTIITPEPDKVYSLQKIDDPDIIYLENNNSMMNKWSRVKRLINRVSAKILPPNPTQVINRYLQNAKSLAIVKKISQFEGEIIAVDFLALWCAEQAGKSAHLVSLEIHTNDSYRDNCSFNKIKSVLIQSEERYRYLFKDLKLEKFIVQNAPSYLKFQPDSISRKKSDLIYCGSAVPGFGIFSCLDFLQDYPEYTLTIKGAVPPATKEAIDMFYSKLYKENRLVIDDSYMDTDTLTHYISTFRAGFVFYDFYRFEQLRTFNYYTAPSGKMFQYLNSGVPVIGNRLSGLEMIESSNAGVLIPYLSSLQIKIALDKIESSYLNIAENAKKVSENFDFTSNIQSFISFIKN